MTEGVADLTLRGHHFLCTLHYRGVGYSAAFTDNFNRNMQAVRGRARTRVQIAGMADKLCGPCPSLQADGQTCEFQDSVMRRDGALLAAMGWKAGEVVDLESAHWAILARRDELMGQVCTGCEWLPRCRDKGPYGMASPLTQQPGRMEGA